MSRRKGQLNDRLWRDAMRKAALERDPETREQYITIAARKTVLAAVQGDISAAKELGDRLDGKPHQTQEIRQENHHYVVEIPVAPQDETTEQWAQRYGHA